MILKLKPKICNMNLFLKEVFSSFNSNIKKELLLSSKWGYLSKMKEPFCSAIHHHPLSIVLYNKLTQNVMDPVSGSGVRRLVYIWFYTQRLTLLVEEIISRFI